MGTRQILPLLLELVMMPDLARRPNGKQQSHSTTAVVKTAVALASVFPKIHGSTPDSRSTSFIDN